MAAKWRDKIAWNIADIRLYIYKKYVEQKKEYLKYKNILLLHEQ